MTTVFISYTHEDTELKKKLLQHLSPLKREGLIDVWHDELLRPGEHLDSSVQKKLAESDLVILLVSSGFISSEYCYEQEMKRAFKRQQEGSVRVVPLILRHCQWKDVPTGDGRTLAAFVALPKDGQPVMSSSWSSPDEAFDNAVSAIRNMLREKTVNFTSVSTSGMSNTIHSDSASRFLRSNDPLGLVMKPTDLDRDHFLRSGFSATATLFEQNLNELKASDLRIETNFEWIDNYAFVASIYLDGNQVGQVTIWYGDGMLRNALCLSYDRITGPRNSMNDWLPVKHTSQGFVFDAENTLSYTRQGGSLDASGAASYFWEKLMNQANSRIQQGV